MSTCGRGLRECTTCVCYPPIPPDVLELDSGQLALSAEVEERGGQLVLEELARPAIPAPLNHTPEHPADDLRQQLTSQEA